MDSLLKVKDLSVQFPLSGKGWFPKKRFIQAVDQLTFDLNPGEILGIVGESGCGKTTLARTIVGLLKPTSGRIYLFGDNLTEMDETGFRSKRQQIQLIFQDPLAALNPRMTIGNIVAEPLREFHPELGRDQIQREVKSLLGRVGILPSQINRYPHQFSGGQCQRVGIARALIVKPKLLLCDEAVSALDVSVQAQIVNLLLDLKKEMGLSIVFISHDLRIVRQLCDRVLVMYLGKIVEINTRQEIYQNPKHPYTKMLIDAVPTPYPKGQPEKLVTAQSYDSHSIDLPSTGCAFSPRCLLREEKCGKSIPVLRKANDNGFVACHLV